MKFFAQQDDNNLYSSNKSLTELANLYETDKGNADSSTLSWGINWPGHRCMNYTETYEQYMKNFRDKKIKLFEVGICDKRFPYASVKLWLSYFKNIDLYSLDNFWGCYLEEKYSDIKMLNKLGCNFIYADQGNFNDWNEIKQKCPNDFDFFIEDGSHWPNHMAVTLWQSKDMLRSGAYYFMEDLQNPETSRGQFRYDNSLLTEDLLSSQKNKKFQTHFLNDQQNFEVNKCFELIDIVLDPYKINYLAVFIRR